MTFNRPETWQFQKTFNKENFSIHNSAPQWHNAVFKLQDHIMNKAILAALVAACLLVVVSA